MRIKLEAITIYNDSRDFGYTLFGLRHELVYFLACVDVRFGSDAKSRCYDVPLYPEHKHGDIPL